MFSSGEGLEVYNDLIKQFGEQTLFNKDNQYDTAFKLGQYDVITYIQNRLNDLNK
ncbi:hypothetical protein [Acinetobacter zhairhuonensis]